MYAGSPNKAHVLNYTMGTAGEVYCTFKYTFLSRIASFAFPGPALMDVWSKALALTASCLSPLALRVRIPDGAC